MRLMSSYDVVVEDVGDALCADAHQKSQMNQLFEKIGCGCPQIIQMNQLFEKNGCGCPQIF